MCMRILKRKWSQRILVVAYITVLYVSFLHLKSNHRLSNPLNMKKYEFSQIIHRAGKEHYQYGMEQQKQQLEVNDTAYIEDKIFWNEYALGTVPKGKLDFIITMLGVVY